MEEKFARIISIIFQPLLIPTFSLIILFSLNSYISFAIPSSAKNMILAMIFIVTFVFPAIFIYLFYKRGIIRSITMEKRDERILPLLVTAVFYFLAFHLIRQLQLHDIFSRMFLGSAILVVLGLIINLRWKISAHMIGIGGLLGGLIGVSQLVLVDLVMLVFLVTIICGLVGYSRLKLNAHTPAQVYAGFLLGFGVMIYMLIQ